ncbi:hypothetical protein AAY473_006875 [Plecturocebus cupreus]
MVDPLLICCVIANTWITSLVDFTQSSVAQAAPKLFTHMVGNPLCSIRGGWVTRLRAVAAQLKIHAAKFKAIACTPLLCCIATGELQELELAAVIMQKAAAAVTQQSADLRGVIIQCPLQRRTGF